MLEKKLKIRYKKLCRTLERHNHLYYVKFKPEVTDGEYDNLYKKLLKMEKDYPELIQKYSPTQRVGAAMVKNQGFEKVKHKTPMLSLSNTFSYADIKSFQKRVKGLLLEKVEPEEFEAYIKKYRYIQYCIEPKYDGISIELLYKKGIFVQAITRGDGVTGDDITANVRTIKNIPAILPNNKKLKIPYPEELTVRGEIYMSYSDFDALNERRALNNQSLFMNPRNAAGGALHLKDPKMVAKRNLKCFVYDIVGSSPHYEHELNLVWLSLLGFPVYKSKVVMDLACAKNVNNILSAWETLRNQIDFPIDGLVIKLNSKSWQGLLGVKTKDPRWATAFKFPADTAETTLENVSYQIGRTGAVTPVAELTPVILAGSRVKRASLHNFSYIEEKGLKKRDIVIIEKAGEIIPQVVRVKEHTMASSEIIPPTECPVCSTALLHKDLASGTKGAKEKALRCPNISCPARMQRQLIHFVGRDSMNIDAVGEKFVLQLFEAGLVTKYSDFYSLTAEQLLALDRVGKKKAAKIITSITKSKEVEFHSFILALGMPSVGTSSSKILAKHFVQASRLRDIINTDRAENAYALNSIEGFGPVLVNDILDYLYDPVIHEEIISLLETGIDPFYEDVVQDNVFDGKSFCITGTLSKGRKEVAKDVEAAGGKISSSVSKKLDYLIAGEKAGSKYSKAEKLGVTIISEVEFYNML